MVELLLSYKSLQQSQVIHAALSTFASCYGTYCLSNKTQFTDFHQTQVLFDSILIHIISNDEVENHTLFSRLLHSLDLADEDLVNVIQFLLYCYYYY